MLTIILPLKNNDEFTERWFLYANQNECPYEIIIADGGNEQGIGRILKDKSSLSKVSYKYIRYPLDENYAFYYNKIADVVSRVKTPYCLLLDNDDFFIYKSIKKSIDFLENNLDYISCGGQYSTFYFKDKADKTYGTDFKINNFNRQTSIDDNSSKNRLNKQFNNYQVNYYHIYRTEALQEYLTIQSELNLKDVFLSEMLLTYLSVIDGKSKYLDDIYLLRQIQFENSSARKEEQKGDYFDRMLSPVWSEEFSEFVKILAKRLSQKDNISYDDAEAAIKKGYRLHVAKYIAHSLSGDLARQNRSILGKISRVLFYANLEKKNFFTNTKINKYDSEIVKIKDFLTQKNGQ